MSYQIYQGNMNQTITLSVPTSTGTGVTMGWYDAQKEQAGSPRRKRIGPRLYFSYVKSKLNKSQVKKLKARLSKLQALVKDAEEMGQKALYEEFSRMLMATIRESEAVACGYDVYVMHKDITKFQGHVSENDKSYDNPVFFKKLEEFPRAIPAKVQKVIKSVKEKGIFDELWILYLDYSGEKIKTNKEKIREKDPILFGKFSYDNEKYYFITDWIDEYCDLTLSKFVEELKSKDEDYNFGRVEEITPEYIEKIKQEVKDRAERLANTKPANFRELMAQEDRVSEQPQAPQQEAAPEPAPKKKPWYKFW